MATNQSTSEISRERALRNWADPEHRARRLAARSARPSVEDRFWAAVEKSGDCWLWVGRRSGTYTVGGHHRRCQRAAWVFAHGGDDPRDKVIRARCGNDRCVNPAHLASVGRDERFNVIPLEVRFWSLVQKTDGCWLWMGSRNQDGYGRFEFGAGGVVSMVGAHRMAWELHHGRPVPPGLWVLHSCDNPPCVRPDHLSVGDRRQNMLECWERGGRQKLEQCQRGHVFTEANTIRKLSRGQPARFCRACSNEMARQRRRLAAQSTD
jgi:hypothetical protein